MTHLNIQQGTNVEVVSTQLIKKLYETALAVPEPLEGEEDAAYMSGHLEVDNTYERYVKYLAGRVGFQGTRVNNAEGRFPNLTIDTTGDYYIEFEDPAMVTYLNSIGVGSADGITLGQASLASKVANSQNTTVTKFNELKYFTAITGSKNGFSGNASGNVRFYQWTALEEVDLRNFTSIGHSNGSGWEDSFCECTSLKTVNTLDDSDNSKLKQIGFKAFYKCSNLEDIIGLSGEIDCYDLCFYNNTKLKNSNFANCTLKLYQVGNDGGNFQNCTALTNITISGSYIPRACFYECTNLTNIAFTDTITDIRTLAFQSSGITHYNYNETLAANDFSALTTITNGAFRYCGNLSGKLYMPNTHTVKEAAFQDCTSITGDLSLPSLTTIQKNAFRHTGITSVSNLGTITTLPENVFVDCNNLTSISLPTTLTSLHVSNFCKNAVTKIIIPEGVTSTLGSAQEFNINTYYIEFPSTVTDMGYFFHRAMENQSQETCALVIKATSVPQLAPYSQAQLYRTRTAAFYGIYVPDSALTAYQNDASDVWSMQEVQSKLKPISQLQTDNPTAWAEYQLRA